MFGSWEGWSPSGMGHMASQRLWREHLACKPGSMWLLAVLAPPML
eukprot:CAMPEP_0195063744 /NCGR_PEP_ID=MMETSP0448-20130528/10048_1 /TAXON_ID=66468 /ORGANISM="Heterocapsa triquestra, Strain CCMP 448" /LENGTH=44 /DNA_ID= /DNA_START= /DNA_END= /DNA_ORIENTATION=